MEYLLLVHFDESGWPKLTKEQQEQGIAAYMEYAESMQKAGVLKSSNSLQPSVNAKIVQKREGKLVVTDGPFAETKEQIGGYFLIDVQDEKAAVEWASRCPGAAHGVVEIRPISRHDC